MIERTESDKLDALHSSIQTFSNALADDENDVGMVTQALIVWEETSFSEDGTPQRQTLYAATGDQATPNGSLGLALHLLGTLKNDIIGCGHQDDDD